MGNTYFYGKIVSMFGSDVIKGKKGTNNIFKYMMLSQMMKAENGLGEFDKLEENEVVNDDYRIKYLSNHVRACKEAITDGVELLGYCTWSFTDLLSWLNGYQKRYGFVYIDRDEKEIKELKRIKKKSFYWYKKVIETNGEEL